MNLDDRAARKALDRDDMHGHLWRMPEVVRLAWQQGLAWRLPDGYRQVDKVLVLGMGGSAIGGDLLASLAAGPGRMPVLVRRGYGLPGFVDSRTLVLASSYSGATEETLDGFRQALSSPAKAVAVTTGGPLLDAASQAGVPVLQFSYDGPPRAAIGYSFLLMLAIAEQLDLFCGSLGKAVEESVEVLSLQRVSLGGGSPERKNPAKQLSRLLRGRMPVIYGAEQMAAVARRWKSQINENANNWAMFEEFPEFNHNSIEGFGLPAGGVQLLSAVFLWSDHYSPRVRMQMEAARTQLKERRIPCHDVDAEGESPLAQMLSAVYFGDWVSYYLSLLNGIDPTQTPDLTSLKRALSESVTV
jgi:glucose/mannose-6-phosphate isomerase